MDGGGLAKMEAWFAGRGREPFAFQRRAWAAYLDGRSGLIQAPTGMGKTLAAAGGVMIEALDGRSAGDTLAAPKKVGKKAVAKGPPLALLWITPLRALAADTVESLKSAVSELGLDWVIELRTSDTSASVRKRQRERLPTVLVTTPESASLLISYSDSPSRFEGLRCIVVDEWHELMGTKRGVQAELALARLRGFRPGVRVWGLSATISNVGEAVETLLGPGLVRALMADANGEDEAPSEPRPPSDRNGPHPGPLPEYDSTELVEVRAREELKTARTEPRPPVWGGVVVDAPDDKPIVLESVLPKTIERFPWAGHLGLKLLKEVVRRIEGAGSTLVFTNTRSQSEIWFRSLLDAEPEWMGKIAIHHGSIDRKTRAAVEEMLRKGELKAVVCTSSLDLGVDFWPVDQVIQIGSPKSVARAMQRAGRSGHRPGAVSKLVCVPTQAFELIEFSAARSAIDARHVEARIPVRGALDVLAQHVVTVAAGGGFDEAELLAEVRDTHAFALLTDEEWGWVMDFVRRGGPTLTAYPRFQRVSWDEASGRWVVASDAIARMHRMGIGTITSDGSIAVQFQRGKRLGSVEESFVAKLKKGDTFTFAGRALEFIKIYQMTALVKAAKRKKAMVPRWMGGKFPISASLGDAVRRRLDEAARGELADEEMRHMRPILSLQERWSAIPREGELLIEEASTRDGHHRYLYPFQGRLVHEGLSALMVFRLSRRGIAPVTATFNDYGIELLSPVEMPLGEGDYRALLSSEELAADVLACVNSSELARRHFREIARIAGLLVQTRPGAPQSVRQLQASSELFFDVFREFDPGNLLMEQARREVLERQLEFTRLAEALVRLGRQAILIKGLERISPMGFPLWAERIASQQLRTESAGDRIERLAKQLEAAAMVEEAVAR